MDFEPITYVLPSWAVCVLINGDTSGISEEEEQSLELFLENENLGQGHWSIPEEESYFSHSNDMNLIPGDVIELTYMRAF